MEWFHTYKSNTLAGSGNQYLFVTEDKESHIGRVYYKVYAGGKYNYSLLFSNVIDSTFFDGSVSRCNMYCDEWRILRASIGVCDTCGEDSAAEPEKFYPLTFQGNTSKQVLPGEFFTTDAIELKIEKDDYLCLEIEFSGRRIPYHEEIIIPCFAKQGDVWIPSKQMPVPGMIGCDRKVRASIGFLGDSITQGIGTAVNSYLHWSARIAEDLGPDYSYWNLGLGFGRAEDAASDGAWLWKAKQMDIVIICFGVNDVCQGRAEEDVKKDLLTIIRRLKEAGVKVMIQTLPPFDLQGEALEKWNHVNDYIRHTLVKEADAVFDVALVLSCGTASIGAKDTETAECSILGKAKYGGHPNEEGCRVWANVMLPIMADFVAEKESMHM